MFIPSIKHSPNITTSFSSSVFTSLSTAVVLLLLLLLCHLLLFVFILLVSLFCLRIEPCISPALCSIVQAGPSFPLPSHQPPATARLAATETSSWPLFAGTSVLVTPPPARLFDSPPIPALEPGQESIKSRLFPSPTRCCPSCPSGLELALIAIHAFSLTLTLGLHACCVCHFYTHLSCHFHPAAGPGPSARVSQPPNIGSQP